MSRIQREPLISVFATYNAKINLSGIREPDAIYEKHIVDSLALTEYVDLRTLAIPPKQERIIADLGTGGGFPLLPLAMTYPDLSFVGIDGTAKKLDAIDAMAAELGITNVRTLWSRAEDCTERFSIITTRAVAYSSKLIPWISPLLVHGGFAFLYKQYTREEENDLLLSCKQWSLDMINTFTYGTDRVIYQVRKNR